jgi:hypothetical protein
MNFKPTIIVLGILIPGICAFAQTPWYCVGRKEFLVNPLLRHAGLNFTIAATFEVRNFRPVNIRLKQLDNDSTSMLQFPETVENLNRIVYLRDTLRATLHLRYYCFPASQLSHDYAYIDSDSVLDVAFRRADSIRYYREIIIRLVPQHGDSIIAVSTLIGSPTTNDPAVIEVERIFNDRVDSSVIIHNSHPELTSQILAASRVYDWSWFQYLQDPDRFVLHSSAKPKFVNSKKRYFVRFGVVRYIPECNYQQAY